MRRPFSLLVALTAGCVAETQDLDALTSARPGDDPSRSGGLVVLPGRVDFGVVDPACGSLTREGLVVNEGDAAVRIEELTLLGDEAGVFRLLIPRVPRTLPPGERLTWTIEAGVETSGAFAARLVLFARTADDRRLRVERPISALGDDAPIRTDRFVQNSRRATDVLFVIDDSASMVAEQDALGRNFVAFLDAANRGLADFQIGVTTTDVSESGERGRLVPVRTERDNQMGTRTAHIVTRSSTPNPVEAFRRNALVGIEGAPTEQGLEAAARALTPPLIEDDNAGFLRDDASLSVVFVSDEDDGSDRPPAYYVDLLLGLKNDDPNRVTASAIVGPEPDGCRGNGGRATAGRAYAEVVRALRGRIESICTTDWGDTLARLSGVAFGLEGRFVLSGRPTGSPMVSVDGSPRPRINAAGQTVWSIDAGAGVLTFAFGFTPPEGATIEVVYPVGCPADDGRP